MTNNYICVILLYLHLIEKYNYILVNCIVYNLFVNDSLLYNYFYFIYNHARYIFNCMQYNFTHDY
nr:MAG TPA: hypothetical protein [Caudoviricetes sp.]